MSSSTADPSSLPATPARIKASSFGDKLFEGLCRGAGILVLLTLGGIIVTLFLGALPALKQYGIAFIWSDAWNPVEDHREE